MARVSSTEAFSALCWRPQTKGLSSYSITETLRSAAIEARHASVALDELAFSFEK